MSEPTTEVDRGKLVRAIAAAFHHEYETQAPGFGWESRTKGVAYNALPEANRQLMEATVGALLDQETIAPGPALVRPFRPAERQSDAQ